MRRRDRSWPHNFRSFRQKAVFVACCAVSNSATLASQRAAEVSGTDESSGTYFPILLHCPCRSPRTSRRFGRRPWTRPRRRACGCRPQRPAGAEITGYESGSSRLSALSRSCTARLQKNSGNIVLSLLFCFLCRSLSFSSWILAEYRTSSSISTENNCEQLRMALDEPKPKRYQRTMRSKKEEYSSGLVSIIAVTTFISRRQRGSIESCILL